MTICTLTLSDAPSTEILALLRGDLRPVRTPGSKLDTPVNEIEFAHIPNGRIPPELRAALQDTDTPFLWMSQEAQAGIAKCLVFDGKNSTNFTMLDGDIVVPVSRATAETLKDFQSLQAYVDKTFADIWPENAPSMEP